MKSYTDLEQSKKLAEILPLESADNYYSWHDERYYVVNKDCPYPYSLKEKIPCWSLAALLQVLPLGIYDEFDNCDYELEIDMIDKMPRYIRLGDIYHSKFPYDFEKDTLLDNVVESIIWLNDNNYFEL
jgi:hypothetical protein